MKVLTTTLLADLKHIIDSDVLAKLSMRYADEVAACTDKKGDEKGNTSDIRTPSTVQTTFKRGSAILKVRRGMRPDAKSQEKMKQTFRTTQVSLGKWAPELKETEIEIQQADKTGNPNLNRKILTDRAVYYGDVDLPYLHSSDAIACLYERKKEDRNSQEPLLNPSPNIASHLLANVKNLYLYYTGIDSVRQLGTGWSNLKSLTIMCSRNLRDLSGLSIFPSLEHLFVPNNCISEISDLMYHGTLKSIDLYGNELALMEQVQYLYTICFLEWVDISQNPITLQREKFRILRENLGNKMEPEPCNKVEDYILSQMELDQEVFSYQGIQHSHSLIKDINEQIMPDQISTGQVWKQAGENRICNLTQDIEIIDQLLFDEDEEKYPENEEQFFAQRNQQPSKASIQLRVTPLHTYLDDKVDLVPLKKYFLNKVCLQKPECKPNETAKSRLINQEKLTKKLANTQSFSRNMSEDKGRLESHSQKKTLKRLSVSKNKLKMGSAQLRNKEQLEGGSSTGVRFLSKRPLLGRSAEKTNPHY